MSWRSTGLAGCRPRIVDRPAARSRRRSPPGPARSGLGVGAAWSSPRPEATRSVALGRARAARGGGDARRRQRHAERRAAAGRPAGGASVAVRRVIGRIVPRDRAIRATRTCRRRRRAADRWARSRWARASGRPPERPARTRVAFLIVSASSLNQAVPSSTGEGRTHKVLPPSLGPGAPIGQAPPVFLLCAVRAMALAGPRDDPGTSGPGGKVPVHPRCDRISAMELSWYGRTCIRLRGKDAVVVHDAYQSIVGPTGRGITARHRRPTATPMTHPCAGRRAGPPRRQDDAPDAASRRAFVLDGPGEYEVKEVLVTGVRTYRDDARGAERG